MKRKPEFTLLKDPDVDDIIKLFEQMTGKKEKVSEAERKELEEVLAARPRRSGTQKST